VRTAVVAIALLTACVAAPPRVDDRTSPKGAYETFRGALYRGEWDREYACLSPSLLGRLGIRNRQEWADLRTIVLGPRHAMVRGIARSRFEGETRRSADTADAVLAFPFGITGSVSLRRIPVLRVYLEGRAAPAIYEMLDRLDVRLVRDGLLLPLPGELRDVYAALLSEAPAVRVEAAMEWFLDGFEVAGATPESVGRGAAGDRSGETPENRS